jgi:hypothetical protein
MHQARHNPRHGRGPRRGPYSTRWRVQRQVSLVRILSHHHNSYRLLEEKFKLEEFGFKYIQSLLKGVNPGLGQELMDLWVEFEKGETLEAQCRKSSLCQRQRRSEITDPRTPSSFCESRPETASHFPH